MSALLNDNYSESDSSEYSTPSVFKQYWGELELIIFDNSYIARQQYHDISTLVLLVCTALHPQITCRHFSKFSVTPMSRNVTKQQLAHEAYSQAHLVFTQMHWQVPMQLQLHCLSMLNPFIPCVCAFAYLSSSIIFTAESG